MLQSPHSGFISHPFACCGSSFEGGLSAIAIVSLLDAPILTLKGSKNGEIREKRQFKRTGYLQSFSHEEPQPAESLIFPSMHRTTGEKLPRLSAPWRVALVSVGGDTVTEKEHPS